MHIKLLTTAWGTEVVPAGLLPSDLEEQGREGGEGQPKWVWLDGHLGGVKASYFNQLVQLWRGDLDLLLLQVGHTQLSANSCARLEGLSRLLYVSDIVDQRRSPRLRLETDR